MDFRRQLEAGELRNSWTSWRAREAPLQTYEDRDESFLESTEGVIKAKRSGVQNLKREGWSEDKCRAYLVKHAQFLPRNYNYSDGMRLLGPLLQYAFGDENGDVALGVVWEFIEIERDPPYPEAIFQKWKFKHLHRHEDLMLPHVPHANTISLPIVVTERLREWRERKSTGNSTALNASLSVSRSREVGALHKLPDHIPASAYKKLYPNWREDAIHISAGGQLATPYLPKQEAIHKMRWNEQHGRGGRLQCTRTLTVEDLVKEKDQVNHIKQEETRTSISIRRSLSRHLKNNPSKSKVIHETGIQESKNSSRIQFDEHLPYQIPNANFARKFGLIPPELTLAGHQIPEQKTACEKQVDSDKALWDKAWEAAKLCREETELDTSDVGKLFSEATAEYHRQPLTPSLFFDGWNDFDFGPEENSSLKSTRVEDAEYSYFEQSIPIFNQSIGGTETSSREFGRCSNADEKLKEPKPDSLYLEDSYRRQFSDLLLRNFAESLQQRTLQTDFMLDGGDVFLTLPATTYDPIHVRAVQSITTIEPTASLLDIFGVSSTSFDASSVQPPVSIVDEMTERNSTFFLGHAQSLTSCSETPEVLPPLVDTPPCTPPTTSPHSSACKQLLFAEVEEPEESSQDPPLNEEDALPIEVAVCADLSPEKMSLASTSIGGETIVEMAASASLPIESSTAIEGHTLDCARPGLELSMLRFKISSLPTVSSDTIGFHQNDSTVEETCTSEKVMLPVNSLMDETTLSRASADHPLPEDDLAKTAPRREHQQHSKKPSLPPRANRRPHPGVANQFCQSETTLNLFIHNKSYINNSKSESIHQDCNVSMDKENNQSPIRLLYMSVQAPSPLRIIKQSNQTQVSQGQNTPITYQPTGPAYSPRSSSVKRRNNTDRHEVIHHEETEHRAKSEIASIDSANSISSECLDRSQSAKYCDKISASTAPSEISNQTLCYLSESSNEILGNFVAIDSSRKMANPFTGKERTRAPYNAPQNRIGQTKVIPNPYEFEPGSPYDNLARQTTFTDFIESQNDPVSSPRQKHVKNAYSGGYTKAMGRPNSSETPVPLPNGRRHHRSESSPSVVAGRFQEHRRRSPSPDTVDPYYYGVYDRPEMPSANSQRGRQTNNSTPHCDRQHRDPDAGSPSRSIRSHQIESRSQGSDSVSYRGRQQAESNLRSPSRRDTRNDTHDYNTGSYHGRHIGHDSGSQSGRNHQHSVENYAQARGMVMDANADIPARRQTNSPGNNMVATETKDFDEQYDSPLIEPKKRSRSPMKKMFGQGGWLANSPSEAENYRQAAKKAAAENKQEAPAKISVMGKIRNKLEEFAEKADMSPIKSTGSKPNKQSKIAILAVSIGPPEQARIYMEVELMLVHTANCFLMSQFRQGRIAIDSIKKTYDNWKNKGRPSVVEFMYDQATQRELIAVNQHNFRFHGERAGDGIRVNSMLYNWKVVASHMVIRTFCNADTVILKLLFDVEQILELLGGAEGILLRLQNIRMSVNEKVHLSRKKRESESAEKFVNGRQVVHEARLPSEDFSRREASGDA